MKKKINVTQMKSSIFADVRLEKVVSGLQTGKSCRKNSLFISCVKEGFQKYSLFNKEIIVNLI